jgi:ribonuclease HI
VSSSPAGVEHWVAVRFRGEKVHARCAPNGELLVGAQGFVEFRYAPAGKSYKSRPESFERLSGELVRAAPAMPEPPAAPSSAEKKSRVVGRQQGSRVVDLPGRRGPEQAVQLWTDGACSGNPGPAGLGVIFEHGPVVREVSEFLGTATNNIAELTAILRGLELVSDPGLPVDVMTDSEYCIGLLGLGWKAKANQGLVDELRAVYARFTDIQLVKVKGHAGIMGNERADELAREAISNRKTRRSDHGRPIG